MLDARCPARWTAAAVGAMMLSTALGARPVEDPPPAKAPSPRVEKPAKPAEPVPVERLKYMRAVEDPGRTVALEVAVRTFRPAAKTGPSVTLVGVSHIAEHGLYGQLQRVLDAHDVVLYESVMPAGAGGASGRTDAERAASTEAVMKFTAGVLFLYNEREGRYPADLSDLAEFAAGRDSRMAQWLDEARTDAWGRPIAYEVGERGGRFVLTSLGADRARGGTGADADLEITSEMPVVPAFLEQDEDNIQAELAKALGLAFQLDGIDYDRPHFRCSDMSMDQLARAMEAEGLEMAPLEGSLGGTSLPARIAVFFMKLIRAVDILFDGVIADGMKVMLIELFSDDVFMEQSLRQFGDGFERVLIDRRNEVVVEDLREILDRERDVESVAIFYGAAHMPDFAERLAGLGYVPADEQWFTAFEVDLDESAMSAEQLRSLRMMIRRQLRMMSR